MTRGVGLVLALGLIVAACYLPAAQGGQAGPVSSSRQVGLTGLENWRLNAPRNYAYRLHAECLCALDGDSRVTVRAGKVWVTTLSGQPRQLPEAVAQGLSIPALFEMLKTRAQSLPDRLQWRLNRYLGYPEWILIDPSYRLADDETVYRISDLQPLP